MKTLKFLTVALLLTLLCGGMAQAQVTPQAVIGQCPDMPSVSSLAAYSVSSTNHAAYAAIEAFQKQIHLLKEKSGKTADRITSETGAAARSDAERHVQKTYGRSVDDFANMSESQLEAFAQQQVSTRTSTAGLGPMSMGQLEALGSKSDEEIMATMLGSGANNTGLTGAEIQAMSKMTEAQQEAYMRQGDRMQRVQAAAATPQSENSRKNAQAQAQNYQSQAQTTAAIKQITDRWQEIDRINQKEGAEVAQKIAEIGARYEPQLAAVPRGTEYSDAWTEGQQRTMDKLLSAMYTEQYTLWRNYISVVQGRIKTKLADVARYDELTAQSLRESGSTSMANAIPSMGFSIADQYINATESVTELPRIR